MAAVQLFSVLLKVVSLFVWPTVFRWVQGTRNRDGRLSERCRRLREKMNLKTLCGGLAVCRREAVAPWDASGAAAGSLSHPHLGNGNPVVL